MRNRRLGGGIGRCFWCRSTLHTNSPSAHHQEFKNSALSGFLSSTPLFPRRLWVPSGNWGFEHILGRGDLSQLSGQNACSPPPHQDSGPPFLSLDGIEGFVCTPSGASFRVRNARPGGGIGRCFWCRTPCIQTHHQPTQESKEFSLELSFCFPPLLFEGSSVGYRCCLRN